VSALSCIALLTHARFPQHADYAGLVFAALVPVALVALFDGGGGGGEAAAAAGGDGGGLPLPLLALAPAAFLAQRAAAKAARRERAARAWRGPPPAPGARRRRDADSAPLPPARGLPPPRAPAAPWEDEAEAMYAARAAAEARAAPPGDGSAGGDDDAAGDAREDPTAQWWADAAERAQARPAPPRARRGGGLARGSRDGGRRGGAPRPYARDEPTRWRDAPLWLRTLLRFVPFARYWGGFL
jgi:hypothetical protein